ncbi:hypothetical protein ANN_10222 [Periplaneta americana]|uniref:Secreted protein n=1 Tax=Periplaneta americana TaxID=6978 RepID=A0ABQ8TPI3_PERAM|nr:hypothetical protein ANN_10222 [Periplaneta americana]
MAGLCLLCFFVLEISSSKCYSYVAASHVVIWGRVSVKRPLIEGETISEQVVQAAFSFIVATRSCLHQLPASRIALAFTSSCWGFLVQLPTSHFFNKILGNTGLGEWQVRARLDTRHGQLGAGPAGV